MPLVGAFGRLQSLRQAMEGLSRGGWQASLNRQLGARALELVQAQFDRGQDPYGKPWAPLKFRRGRPLLNTGHLRNTFSVASSASGFRLRSSHPGAQLHNYGGIVRPVKARFLAFKVGGTRGGRGKGAWWVFAQKVVIPQRRIIPESNRLGGTWANALRATARAFVRARLARGSRR